MWHIAFNPLPGPHLTQSGLPCLQGGNTCVLTNFFKLATLPEHLYLMAMQLIMLYEEEGLVPPTESTQRKTRELSSSSFNFLCGLNPLNKDDFHLIECCLHDWRTSGVTPESAVTKVTNLNEGGKRALPFPTTKGTSIRKMNHSRDDTFTNNLDFETEEEYKVPNKKSRKRLKVGELSG